MISQISPRVFSVMNLTAKNQKWILFLFWLFIQAGLFVQYGVNTGSESLKYIYAAQNLLEGGQLPETRYFFYLTTTLLIAFCLKTGVGYYGVVVFQLLLNLFATFYFFSALQQIQQKRHSAFFTVLALISFLPYQTWNFYLYTESVFYSCALLFFSSCIKYTAPTAQPLLLQAFFLFLTIISRPLGILFLPCWILFLAFKKKIKPTVISLALLLSIIVAVTVINTIMTTIGDWQILKPAEFRYIICDIPSGTKLNLNHLKQYTPLSQLGHFIYEYPSTFLALSGKRLQAFYLLHRSYYGSAHNLYLLFYAALFTLPFLYAAFFLKKSSAIKPSFYLALFIISGFTVAIMLQCDDYHNRFHHSIVPVFLFGGLFLLQENWRRDNFQAT